MLEPTDFGCMWGHRAENAATESTSIPDTPTGSRRNLHFLQNTKSHLLTSYAFSILVSKVMAKVLRQVL